MLIGLTNAADHSGLDQGEKIHLIFRNPKLVGEGFTNNRLSIY